MAVQAAIAGDSMTKTKPWQDALRVANVVWDSPSADSWGSMPIGNGDIGANVWVEPSGDLVLLLSKTDAWDEVSRLCKLGRIRIRTQPTLVRKGRTFRQELDLATGTLRITTGGNQRPGIRVRVWIDANRPVVRVEIEGDEPFVTSVRHETWRTEERRLSDGEIRSCWGLAKPYYRHDLPQEEVRVYPDTVLDGQTDRIVFFHRNPTSVWERHLRLQKVYAFVKPEDDPLRHRTFGAIVQGSGLVADGKSALVAKEAARKCVISITALTARTETADAWVERVTQAHNEAMAISLEDARAAHAAWWRDFWSRSWIHVRGRGSLPVNEPTLDGAIGGEARDDPEADSVTRGYALQRWMNACAGRGGAAIKFNGSIFNVDCVRPIKTYIGTVKFDADFREWGDPYWWQNTRLIYWTMPLAGDFDLMRPMFKMYSDALPIRKHATRTYFKHGGAFFPEVMQHWGTAFGKRDTYRWDPKHPEAAQEWWGEPRPTKLAAHIPNSAPLTSPPGWYWQSGIELVTLMLAYYRHTGDEAFRDKQLLPMAEAVLEFYDTHWPRKEGRLHFFPISSLEAIQNGTNPMPELAGLRFILPPLIACSPDETQKATWRKMLTDLPPLPMGGEPPRLLAAEGGSRHSDHENPEFYAVWPYELHGLGKADVQPALNAWPVRRDKANRGWNQDGVHAAMIGLTGEARKVVVGRFGSPASGFRFPGFYGPNYDWIPDQCHGCTAMRALQAMVMQTAGDRIMLLPAWPKEWDVSFKLHAPGQTTVECEFKDGKIRRLNVTPESRRRDVQMNGAVVKEELSQ
jgi:alpha-L-fucosidase 2